jgi:hypothetical protein
MVINADLQSESFGFSYETIIIDYEIVIISNS